MKSLKDLNQRQEGSISTHASIVCDQNFVGIHRDASIASICSVTLIDPSSLQSRRRKTRPLTTRRDNRSLSLIIKNTDHAGSIPFAPNRIKLARFERIARARRCSRKSDQTSDFDPISSHRRISSFQS